MWSRYLSHAVTRKAKSLFQGIRFYSLISNTNANETFTLHPDFFIFKPLGENRAIIQVLISNSLIRDYTILWLWWNERDMKCNTGVLLVPCGLFISERHDGSGLRRSRISRGGITLLRGEVNHAFPHRVPVRYPEGLSSPCVFFSCLLIVRGPRIGGTWKRTAGRKKPCLLKKFIKKVSFHIPDVIF